MQNNKLKIGLCAFGMSGKVFHAPLLTGNPHFDLTAIVERTKQEASRYYPNVTIYRNINDLLGDQEVSIIVVNTPDLTHFDYAAQALEAGKHVVVEKPFTLKSLEAEKLITLAKKKNRVLTVFQNRRWDGDFLTVKSVIDRNLLGRLVEFESHFDRYRNFIQPGTWKEKAGTGTLYNLGSHMIDQAVVLFGKPEAVMADIRALRSGSEVDDSYQLWLYYPGVRVTIKASYLVREPGPRYILNGTLGSFLKPGLDVQEEQLKTGMVPADQGYGIEPAEIRGLLNTDINGKPVCEKMESEPGNYPAFYENLYQHIANGAALAVNPEEPAFVIRIIEAAYESSKLRKVVWF